MTKTILGGGLSGISAAYYLLKHTAGKNIEIIEASSRTGGWIKSNLQPSGILFEQGPRTIRPRGLPGANTLHLVEDLKLSDKVIPIPSTHPAAINRLVYAKEDLHLLPSSLTGLFKKGKLFSKPLIIQLLNDWSAPRKIVKDESIYNFINRRFGAEVADYLISPLICGICAGNAKEVSVKFLMESLFEYEQKYGSISKGIISNLFTSNSPSLRQSELVTRAKNERWNVYSFNGGCEVFPLALTKHNVDNKVTINLNSTCTKLTLNPKEAIIHLVGDQIKYSEHVISTLPAQFLANLIQEQHPKLSTLLNNIKNVSVGVVNLHFKGKLLPNAAFGFLVAPKEELPILGVIYDSCCFPTPNDSTVLTVMMGGHWFEKYFGSRPSEEQLLTVALEQIKNILKIQEQPVEYKVNILYQCLPQYVVGHKENLEKIDNYIKEFKLPLSICGSSYHGVGVNDVILSAKNIVEQMNK